MNGMGRMVPSGCCGVPCMIICLPFGYKSIIRNIANAIMVVNSERFAGISVLGKLIWSNK